MTWRNQFVLWAIVYYIPFNEIMWKIKGRWAWYQPLCSPLLFKHKEDWWVYVKDLSAWDGIHNLSVKPELIMIRYNHWPINTEINTAIYPQHFHHYYKNVKNTYNPISKIFCWMSQILSPPSSFFSSKLFLVVTAHNQSVQIGLPILLPLHKEE